MILGTSFYRLRKPDTESLLEFDNGSLKDDPILAQQLVDSLLAGTEDDISVSDDHAQDPLIQVHNTVWRRVAKVLSDNLPPFCFVGHSF
jgi:hypothetical protein